MKYEITFKDGFRCLANFRDTSKGGEYIDSEGFILSDQDIVNVENV